MGCLWRWRWIAAFVLPFMEFGLVRLFLVVAPTPQQRGEGSASTSGRQLDPTDVDINDYVNSMHKCSMKVVVRQPRYPDRRNCRPREGGFTAICDCRKNVIRWLPDSQPLPRRCGFPHQLELEDSIVVCGLARRLVQLHR